MKTAWYIDDDEEMLQAISLMVQMLGYETEIFLNASSAVTALLDGQRPALILLDVIMPEISGIDFLRRVRSDMGIRDIPIIMVSAEFNDVQIHQALDLGADAYIIKPVTLEELESVIELAEKAHKKV